MAKRLSAEIKEKITLLYDNGNGLTLSEIARKTGFSYSSIYYLTKIRQRINLETGQPFISYTEYQDYLARQRTNPKTGKNFASRNEYGNYCIKLKKNPETGKRFTLLSEYENYHARQRTNPKTGKNFASHTEYKDYLAKQRMKRPENQELSSLIRKRLRELGKNQSWLAEKIGTRRVTISNYIKGKYAPKEYLLEKLYSSLDLPYKTLDDFVEDRALE